MDPWTLLVLPLGLGLLGFIEPCTVGSSLLFVKYLEGKEAAAKLLETSVFTATRGLFIGALGALAALVGSAFLDLQRWFWVLLGSTYGVLGLVYLAGKHWKLMRVLGPKLNRVRSARGAATLGVIFGLNIPACAAPLLAAGAGVAGPDRGPDPAGAVLDRGGVRPDRRLVDLPGGERVTDPRTGDPRHGRTRLRRQENPTERRSEMKRMRLLARVAPLVLALGACDLRERPAGVDAGGPVIPSVRGYAEGEEILFIHTEASDKQVADTLTTMMKSPVLVVRALAQVPEAARAAVYVFANGIRTRGAQGPFGYQPDVFDAPPGTPAYSPLREVHLVTWRDPSRARVLKSAAEVRQAEAQDEVTIERPGAVVNMPFLTWPGGGER